MLIREANEITGGLTRTSKMPGPSYSLPAGLYCPVGSKLMKIPGSTCSKCYALKGRYRFGNVQDAQMRRLQSLTHPRWVEAMILLIRASGCGHFRWHDSGDIQTPAHLENICAVASALPTVRFWLPTRELNVVRSISSCPSNLIIRVSSTLIDAPAPKSWPLTSTVVTQGATCPAPTQNGQCGSCRKCWDSTIPNIAYKKH